MIPLLCCLIDSDEKRETLAKDKETFTTHLEESQESRQANLALQDIPIVGYQGTRSLYRPPIVNVGQSPNAPNTDFERSTMRYTSTGKWVQTDLAKTQDFASLSTGFQKVFEKKVNKFCFFYYME
jgi:hypothetical protein